MKTIFSFFLVLGMVLFLTGCLGDDGEGGITTAGTDQGSSSSLVVTSSSLADDGLSSGSEEPESSASGSSSSSVTDVSSSSVQIVSSSSSYDSPYFSSGIFCWTEDCEVESSSSAMASSSSAIITSSASRSSSSVAVSSSSVSSSSSVLSSSAGAVIVGNKLLDQRNNEQYSIVTTGGHVWMAENLRYSPDGASGIYAYGNDESYVKTYGYLYTYAAAQTACPAGWHLPTRDDVTSGIADAATFPRIYAGRMNGSDFSFIDDMGFSWTSATYESDKDNCSVTSCAMILVQKSPEYAPDADPAQFFQRDEQAKGFSVRCVQD